MIRRDEVARDTPPPQPDIVAQRQDGLVVRVVPWRGDVGLWAWFDGTPCTREEVVRACYACGWRVLDGGMAR